MADTLDAIRIRPAMRSRANLDGFCVVPGKGDAGCCVGRHHDHDLDPPRLDRPRALGKAVGCNVLCASMRETAARTWPYIKLPIPRSGRRQTTHPAMQPVGHSSQGIVIERGHLARIDRAIWAEAVPALPDGGRTHRHGIEP